MAQADPAFRQALIRDSKTAIEKLIGEPLPDDFRFLVVEETATTNYLVLPAAGYDELSIADLEVVSGGETDDQKQMRAMKVMERAFQLISQIFQPIVEQNKKVTRNIRH